MTLETFGPVRVRWRRSCDEDFRNYWSIHLTAVLPHFPDLDDSVIEIGVTESNREAQE